MRLRVKQSHNTIHNKPVIITDCNRTKGGIVDKLCASYDCSRNTRRWPTVIFTMALYLADIKCSII